MSSRLTQEVSILHRHLTILTTIHDHEPIGLITLTNHTHYPLPKVRATINKLEATNTITTTPNGIHTTDTPPEFNTYAHHLRNALKTTSTPTPPTESHSRSAQTHSATPPQ